MVKTISFETEKNGVVDITSQVKQCVAESGVENGMCLITTPHTTAGVTIISYHDPNVFKDVHDEIGRLVPTRIDFNHQFDTPSDAAGHIKSVIVGVSLSLIVTECKLLLGMSQGVFFVEFDGPRKRQVHVQMISE